MGRYTASMVPEDVARAWMAQWREAAPALAEQRARELALLTDEEVRAAIAALLDLGASLPISSAREQTSGLVTQQALFHGRRPPS